MHSLITKRLLLRPWSLEDLEPFAALNADVLVREHFPTVLTKEQSDQDAKRIQSEIESKGWGFWVVEIPGVVKFAGMIGLNHLDHEEFPVFFTPAVEVGWRLAREYWGQGFATEGALACLQFGFSELNLSKIVAFTAVNNQRSRHVMERIGMHYTQDFEHPNMSEGHPLRRHALYSIEKGDNYGND